MYMLSWNAIDDVCEVDDRGFTGDNDQTKTGTARRIFYNNVALHAPDVLKFYKITIRCSIPIELSTPPTWKELSSFSMYTRSGGHTHEFPTHEAYFIPSPTASYLHIVV